MHQPNSPDYFVTIGCHHGFPCEFKCISSSACTEVAKTRDGVSGGLRFTIGIIGLNPCSGRLPVLRQQYFHNIRADCEYFDSLSPTIDKQSDAMRERYVEPQKGGTYTKHEHQALVLLRENKLMSKFQYPSKTKASFLKITPQEQTIPETFSKKLQPMQSPNNHRHNFIRYPIFANGRTSNQTSYSNC